MQEDSEDHARRLANALALRDLLATNAEGIPGIVTLDDKWEANVGARPSQRQIMTGAKGAGTD